MGRPHSCYQTLALNESIFSHIRIKTEKLYFKKPKQARTNRPHKHSVQDSENDFYRLTTQEAQQLVRN